MLIHFPTEKGKTAEEADAFLTKRGLVLRALKNYRPAACAAHDRSAPRRPTASSSTRLRDFMAGRSDRARRIFERVALIGFGLIGGSIARAARAQGLAGEIVTTARSEKTRARVVELGIVDHVVETNAEAVKDADLVILCIPVGACGAGRAGDRARI